MLSEDEKKAIEDLNSFKSISILYGNTFTMFLDQLKKYQQATDTVLNLITKLQKENKELKTTINKQSLDISNNLIELQQKDRQIDLMAIRILVKIIGDYPCGYKQDCIKSNKEYRDIHCKDCIKQYFETKAKKGE